jgi:hypothetical protein
MPVKVRGPEAAATDAADGAGEVVRAVDVEGEVDAAVGVPDLVAVLVELVELVVELVVAVARMSSTVDSRAPHVASTWTSCAVKRATLVRATRSEPVCALSAPTVVGLEVVATVARSDPGCSQIVSARPTRCAGQSCWAPGVPR